MPRHNRNLEGLIHVRGKVRKRGCSSSSSSSSILQNNRFKRAILVGRRGGSSTPVPTWKMSSPSSMAESPIYQSLSQSGAKAKQSGNGNGGTISARKLAATLWEMNEVPCGQQQRKKEKEEREEEEDWKDKRARRRSMQSSSLPRRLSDPSHSPGSEMGDRSGTGSLRRRLAAISQRYNKYGERNSVAMDSRSSTSLMEIETRSRGLTPSGSMVGMNSRFKELGHGLTTSKELLKILNRIWGMEEQHSSHIALVSALRAELDRAKSQLDQLMQDHRSDRHEIDYLMKRFADEKAMWKSREQERIRAAVQALTEELDAEKRLRRRAESLNKKLSREINSMRTSLVETEKELERERKARELMEEVCDELARGIGEDKAEVEELKRESAKVREEVEREREMLQLADVWREERVQMKLADARYQLEEKNAVLDKLRNELEAFLRAKRTKGTATEAAPANSMGEVEEERQQNQERKVGVRAQGDQKEEEGVDEEEDDSAESDMHSIELNRDDHSKGYKWGYVSGERKSFEEEVKGRKSSEKVPSLDRVNRSLHGGARSHDLSKVTLERSLSEGIEWDFSTGTAPLVGRRDLENLQDGFNQISKHKDGFDEFYQEKNGFDPGRCSDTSELHGGRGPTQSEINGVRRDNDSELQKLKSLKGRSSYGMAGTRVSSAQGFASPTRQWSQRWPSQESVAASGERSKATDMAKGMRESSLKSRLLEAKVEGQSSRLK
ncbi:hypothetical protein AMTRI_Chr06g191460 [Amborella trichopoda]|uniref:Uncharacterized protein n=1 Tax=Amborella trichopoda TaxID=13333 RepID=W1PF52_AMBTC|nr:uncharacterized protein At5g41620 [Amborella trichopoda]ERN06349.1 hypothetical protein AMTR_s00016p00242920 [Amborella trichopoda]|eukprot:XP_006844674.1 uncharacterized protein At5g41620 [Amborella trichopoda]